MLTLPPILPLFAVVAVPDELLDELPPQAATKDAAATNMSHLKRFIDTLRSPLDDRQLIAGTQVYLGNT
jgi:hypothetical protein